MVKRRWKLPSKSSPEEQPEQPRVPELEVGVVIRVFKDHYSVVCDRVENREYYLRFKQLSTGLTIQGMTHAKGTLISPRFLLQILERFHISIPDFLESLNVIPIRKEPRSAV